MGFLYKEMGFYATMFYLIILVRDIKFFISADHSVK